MAALPSFHDLMALRRLARDNGLTPGQLREEIERDATALVQERAREQVAELTDGVARRVMNIDEELAALNQEDFAPEREALEGARASLGALEARVSLLTSDVTKTTEAIRKREQMIKLLQERLHALETAAKKPVPPHKHETELCKIGAVLASSSRQGTPFSFGVYVPSTRGGRR